ncbi:hypothetical protein [Subtercola boreus]|nr:hypothetical protein [Subtercola boreus]
MSATDSDPFHDFTVPQDADMVSAPTPNSADDEAESTTDDDPLGSDD